MPVSAALALAPGLRLRERETAAETEALLGIAAWAMQCTSSVALEFPDLVLLEVSGSLKLFGGLKRAPRKHSTPWQRLKWHFGKQAPLKPRPH